MSVRISTLALAALFMVVFGATSMLAQAAAQKNDAQAPLKQAAADVQAAEDYLNGLRTLKARFVQTDNEGHQLAGTFLLKRPGRMRFEYDTPIKDFIVADGTFVHYYDAKMKQQSSAPISRTLANFFLQKDITLSGDIFVDEIRREKDDSLLILTLSQKKDPLAGNLSLAFARDPKSGALSLLKWRVIDPQGLITETALFNTETGISLKNDQFHYYDPERTKPQYN